MQHTKNFQDNFNKWSKATEKELITRQVAIENYVAYKEDEIESLKDEGRAIEVLLNKMR